MKPIVELRKIEETYGDAISLRSHLRELIVVTAGVSGLVYAFLVTGSVYAFALTSIIVGVETYCIAIYLVPLYKVISGIAAENKPKLMPKWTDALILSLAGIYLLGNYWNIVIHMVNDMVETQMIASDIKLDQHKLTFPTAIYKPACYVHKYMSLLVFGELEATKITCR